MHLFVQPISEMAKESPKQSSGDEKKKHPKPVKPSSSGEKKPQTKKADTGVKKSDSSHGVKKVKKVTPATVSAAKKPSAAADTQHKKPTPKPKTVQAGGKVYMTFVLDSKAMQSHVMS